MQRWMRLVCVGYLFFLTALLWTRDPTQLVGAGVAGFLHPLMPVAHFLAFLVLAVLAETPRWPLPRWAIALLLAAYGGMTEIVQGYVSRTPDWLDWFQDLVGIAVGATLCWGVAFTTRAVRSGWRGPQPDRQDTERPRESA
jgi:hypothetical protein